MRLWGPHRAAVAQMRAYSIEGYARGRRMLARRRIPSAMRARGKSLPQAAMESGSKVCVDHPLWSFNAMNFFFARSLLAGRYCTADFKCRRRSAPAAKQR